MFPLKHECTFYERVIALMEYNEIANPTELARQIFFKLDKHIKVDENTDHKRLVFSMIDSIYNNK